MKTIIAVASFVVALIGGRLQVSESVSADASPSAPNSAPASPRHMSAGKLERSISFESLFPNDEDEIRNIPEEFRDLFKDFCILARDETMDRIDTEANRAARIAYESLFDKMLSAGKSVLDKQRQPFARGGQVSSRNDSSSDDDNFARTGSISPQRDEIRSSAKEEIKAEKGLNLFQRIFRTTRAIIFTAFENAKANAQEYARTLLEQFSKEDFAVIEKGCETFKAISYDLVDKFEKEKTRWQVPNIVLGDLTLEKLKCATTSRVITITKGCEAFTTIQKFVLPAIRGEMDTSKVPAA